MKTQKQTGRGRPWYLDAEEQCERAWTYLLSLNEYRKSSNPAYNSEFADYYSQTMVRMIFESNRIEKAGPSEGETKKLILEQKVLGDEERAEKIARQFIQENERKLNSNSKFIILGRRKRSEREVLQHQLALTHAHLQTMAHFTQKNGALKQPILFSEELIKSIHFLIAQDLLPRGAGVSAGLYRKGPVHVDDPEVSFVSWQNVSRAMHLFVSDANETMRNIDMNPVMKAAKISYDLVGRIHPFPDFNGRLSRIIINMVLQYHGLPFFAALRGNAKEKHRYIWSLKRANRGDLNPYACLIARAVNRGFEELNRNMETAGLEPINPVSLTGK